MCGEQAHVHAAESKTVGSPPRVRGTGLNRGILQIVDRITPACAGNSSPEHIYKQTVKDHPRVCGEQIFMFIRRWVYGGSPPRVRGTVIAIDII